MKVKEEEMRDEDGEEEVKEEGDRGGEKRG